MATIEKRSGSYRVRWYDHAGARRSSTFQREREAKAFVRERERERDRIRAGLEAPPLLLDVVDYLEEHRFPDLRSANSYRSVIHKHLLPAFGSRPLVQIDKEALDRFSSSLRVLSPKTRKNILAVLRMMLRTATDLEWLWRVPRIDMPKVRQTQFAYLYRPEDFGSLQLNRLGPRGRR